MPACPVHLGQVGGVGTTESARGGVAIAGKVAEGGVHGRHVCGVQRQDEAPQPGVGGKRSVWRRSAATVAEKGGGQRWERNRMHGGRGAKAGKPR